MPEHQIVRSLHSTCSWALQFASTARAAVPNGVVPILTTILLGTSPVGSANAEVKSVAPNGFEIIDTATIQAAVEAALTEQWISIVNTHFDVLVARPYVGAYFFPAIGLKKNWSSSERCITR